MTKKARIQTLRKEKDSPYEALRILASLIARSHLKKFTKDRKSEGLSGNTGDMSNG